MGEGQSQREEEKPANNYGHFAADGRYQTERPSSGAPTPVPEQAPAAPAAKSPAKEDGGDDWGLSVSASLLSQNKDRFEEQRRDLAMRSSGPTPADRAASGNNGPAGKNYGGGKGHRFGQQNNDNNGGNKGMKGNWGKNRFDNGQKDARSKGNWRDNMGKGSQDNQQRSFGNPKGKKGGGFNKGGNKGFKGKGKNYGNNNGGYGGNDGGF